MTSTASFEPPTPSVPRREILLLFLFLMFPLFAASAQTPSTADHHRFDELRRTFGRGPDVTRACLGCHTEAAEQIHETIHWTWSFTNLRTGQRLGKREVVNNFCMGLASNWSRCTSCHVGYGWRDERFDFAAEENVDCLVCHDGTGTYRKFPTAAGHPAYEPRRFPPGTGPVWEPPDLAHVARNVALPERQHCGACHFHGGGGDGVKHGHLDSSLIDPPRELDVHMATEGPDFRCQTCHVAGGHRIGGSRYRTRPSDPEGQVLPGRADPPMRTCESCHGSDPHEGFRGMRLNRHGEVLACTSCHVPEIARGGVLTKVWWDWSTAGRVDEDGEPFVERGEHGRPVYDTRKGSFRWAQDLVPDYQWYDGDIVYTLPDMRIDPQGVVQLNRISGDPRAPRARIWPFKTMRGRQPFDVGRNTLLVTHLFGQGSDAFWRTFDWDEALRAGAEARGLDYSGEHGFVETAYHWPVTHMVAPAEDSVPCEGCHRRGGRMAAVAHVYVPGEDRVAGVDLLGRGLVLAVLAGVTLHGSVRLGFRRFRGPRA